MKFKCVAPLLLLFAATEVAAKDTRPAYKIGKKVQTVDEVKKRDQSGFYELEKKMFDRIESLAREDYLNQFWKEKAAKEKKSVEKVTEEYFTKHVKVSEKEIKDMLVQVKDSPKLSHMSEKERRERVVDYLRSREAAALVETIIQDATKSGKLTIMYPQPEEPVYEVVANKDDHVRYGPKLTDTKPIKCKGDDCAITIFEYSEFQCPFCSRVLPDVKRILTEYKGDIRWISRDFPLSFHDRAKPAAIAAKCAAFQGKYWEMYTKLFDNQRRLGDDDLFGYAKSLALDEKKFRECYANSEKARQMVDANFQSGAKLGVTGTPAFFINGRRLSGALPYAEFKRVIDDELAKIKRKS